jgi:mono/diheme cytochrome c family protein
MTHSSIFRPALATLTLSLSLVGLAGCVNSAMTTSPAMAASDGPVAQGPTLPTRHDGNAAAGRDVFRFETFGNEGFWTDAVRLPQGMVAAGVTPYKALQLGLQIDMDALDAATQHALADQLRVDPSGRTSAMLNDPKMLVALVNANAVIGMPAKDSNHDGKIDVGHGDKAGASCALCHTITDGAAFNMPNGGSIGHRQDGRTNHNLDLGAIFASAANSRALYPVLELSLKANGGKSLGRAPMGLTADATEADVDAYLTNKQFYPVGMFDDTFDGNGDPMHVTPLFRQDLAAPYGSTGLIARLDNFSNLVYTTLFDQTELTTPGGRAFLHTLGGAAGDEIADNYVKILHDTGVKGYPYVKASAQGKPGEENNPIGLRVNNQKLLDMNAYLTSLPAPAGASVDMAMASRGREVFRTAGCTGCHNVDQGRPVPTFIVPMKRIFPGDNPITMAQRMPPLNPVMNTPGSIFDDKMAVVNASARGEMRGIAMPLLLDLARKPVFLHDNSVANLDDLLDAKRGADVPHPFYLSRSQRADVVQFLKGLDTGPMTASR